MASPHHASNATQPIVRMPAAVRKMIDLDNPARGAVGFELAVSADMLLLPLILNLFGKNYDTKQ
jgi:hypothetical protein